MSKARESLDCITASKSLNAGSNRTMGRMLSLPVDVMIAPAAARVALVSPPFQCWLLLPESLNFTKDSSPLDSWASLPAPGGGRFSAFWITQGTLPSSLPSS